MKRVNSILALALAAFWLLASSHTLLHGAGLIHGQHPDHAADSTVPHEHNTDNHEAADGRCALSATHVSVPQPNVVAMPMLFCAPGSDWASELHVEQQPSGLAPPGTAPPQLSHCWQFSFRTALPARAPSLIS